MRRRLFAGFRPLSGFGLLRMRSSQNRSISLPESKSLKRNRKEKKNFLLEEVCSFLLLCMGFVVDMMIFDENKISENFKFYKDVVIQIFKNPLKFNDNIDNFCS